MSACGSWWARDTQNNREVFFIAKIKYNTHTHYTLLLDMRDLIASKIRKDVREYSGILRRLHPHALQKVADRESRPGKIRGKG